MTIILKINIISISSEVVLNLDLQLCHVVVKHLCFSVYFVWIPSTYRPKWDTVHIIGTNKSVRLKITYNLKS